MVGQKRRGAASEAREQQGNTMHHREKFHRWLEDVYGPIWVCGFQLLGADVLQRAAPEQYWALYAAWLSDIHVANH